MRDISNAEIARLQADLDEWAAAVPARSPLDVSALDGFLCAVLLQPRPVPRARWWPSVLDVEARPPAPATGTMAPGARRALTSIEALVARRHQALAEAIAARRWFDPWLFELDAEGGGKAASHAGPATPAAVRDSVLPWVGGFALAAGQFPALLRHDAAALAEPLALLYQHFDAADLEGLDDEPQLAAALNEIEPPADLTEAAQDLVRAVLLLADISRPVAARAAPGRTNPAPGPPPRAARPARARRR